MRSLLFALPLLSLASPALAGGPMKAETAFQRGELTVKYGKTKLVSVPVGQKLMTPFVPFPALFPVEGGKMHAASGTIRYKLAAGTYFDQRGFKGRRFQIVEER